MRGMFTAGVMDVLMENGITFDGAVGVSAGAAFGCNYKSHQIGRVIRYNTAYCRDRRYCGLHSLLTTGNIYSTEFCYGTVPLVLDPFDFETYKKDPMDFYVVCTDVATGEAVYHRYTGEEPSVFDWIRASASLPLVAQMVKIDDKRYLDGGIADSIPIRFFEGLGYDRNVVVLTRPRGYEKKKNPLMPLIRMKYRRYPNLIRASEKRHIVYNETLSYLAEKEKQGQVLVIRPPSPLPAGKVEKDPAVLQKTYEIGREEALRRLGAIRAYLGC